MRLKTEIWVKAYLRRVMSEGLAAYIVARGDDFAGAVFIHVDDLEGGHFLFVPAPAGVEDSHQERFWVTGFAEAPVSIERVQDYLLQQRQYDPDLWIIEIEDRQGRHFLGDLLVEQ